MSEDPELAQARAFVRELMQHAQALVRRREALPAEAPASRYDAELGAVRRQIAQLHKRSPALRAAMDVFGRLALARTAAPPRSAPHDRRWIGPGFSIATG